MAFQVAMQRVKPPTWSVHVFRSFGVVQRKKLLAETFSVLRLDACLGTRPKESLKALVPEALYHLV